MEQFGQSIYWTEQGKVISQNTNLVRSSHRKAFTETLNGVGKLPERYLLMELVTETAIETLQGLGRKVQFYSEFDCDTFEIILRSNCVQHRITLLGVPNSIRIASTGLHGL